MTQRAAIIDDVAAAVERLTPLGRSVVLPAARAVREALLVFASVAGWDVVTHSTFAAWTRGQLAGRRGLILDPLIDVTGWPADVTFGRFSRSYSDQGWQVTGTVADEMAKWPRPFELALVDDVANSGMTLGFAAKLARERGGRPLAFVSMCSTAFARQMLLKHFPDATCIQFLEGDYAAIHLRDGCPFLPLAGRVLVERPPVPVDGGEVQIRTLSIASRGGLWEHAASSTLVRQAISSALHGVIQRLSEHVGAEACVADLPLLGAEVALPLLPQQEAAADTRLSDLWT